MAAKDPLLTARKRAPLPANPADAPRCIVGIGASAGGFEPIRALIEAMPPDSGLAFVVIQHLAPTHKSVAAELLGRHTRMRVIEAEDGVHVAANCVYTAPSDKFLAIEQGVLRVAPIGAAGRRAGAALPGPRLPIDRFFTSLARDQHERAVGIILSGTGSDGVLGVRAIAKNGGIVLVQEPGTAQFDGMPRSAIAARVVNQVLAVGAMPDALRAYANHRYVLDTAAAEMPEEDEVGAFERLLGVIRMRLGFDFSGYKHGTLLRRIRRRMALLAIEKLDDYCALLDKTPQELEALHRDLFIGVTEFFRDVEAWNALRREVIEPLLAGHSGTRPIRAWVPGCATGEEAYTLAMLLLAAVADGGKRIPVQVFATDVNEQALAVARTGIYPASIAALVPAQLMRRYFVDAADAGQVQVAPALRAAVTFSPHNLSADPPFSNLDLVSCRNLLIYLDNELQDRVLATFRFALEPRGALFLGSAESVGKHGRLFACISRKWRIFRARGVLPRGNLSLASRVRGPVSAASAPRVAPRQALDPGSLARRLILERFAPAAVLVNAAFEALYFSGPTEKYLLRPHGTPTQNLLLLVREGMRSRMRGALLKAAATRRSVSLGEVRFKRGRTYVNTTITVAPASDGEQRGGLLLVVFEDRPREAKAPAGTGGKGALVKALEADLLATQNDLQNSVENLESSNQELTAAHQELLSGNEELQSINEELESSREELQSLNEELSTVNQQLQNKIAELESANANLNSVVVSSEIATLWLDRELRIKWYSPAMEKDFNLLAADAGRPVKHLGSPLADAGLVEDAATVLEQLEPVEHQQTLGDGRHLLRRIVPFRRADGGLEGVIVTYFDMTGVWRTAMSALDARKIQAASLEAEVRERTRQIRELAFALNRTEERERRNLAENLHDDLSQVLSIAQIKLATARKSTAGGPLDPILAEIGELLGQVNRTVHSLAFQLSPTVLHELGLMPAIEWLAEETMRQYGLKVAVRDDGEPKPLEEDVMITLYRAVRELLINVAKHAKVSVAEVACRRAADTLVLEIQDGGAGFDADAIVSHGAGGAERGFGLVSVRERMELINGTLQIRSLKGDGTTVTLTAPLRLPAPEGAKPGASKRAKGAR